MEDLFNAMTFQEAFDQFIKGRTVVDFGFRLPEPVLLSNGHYAYPCGYYTLYDNGFKFIAYGHGSKTTIQDAWILDTEDRPVGYKDQEFVDEN